MTTRKTTRRLRNARHLNRSTSLVECLETRILYSASIFPAFAPAVAFRPPVAAPEVTLRPMQPAAAQSTQTFASNAAAAPVLPGDFNNDGTVDLLDYNFWFNNVGNPKPAGGMAGDPNLTGAVDLVDFDIWTANVGRHTLTPAIISMRHAGELDIAGTSGNDSISISQSGSTLTIVSNGVTSTSPVPASGLFIYSNGGTDNITINSSVTVRLTIATIDGTSTSISNADPNASIWIDSTDTFSGTGSIHKVASFYGGVSKAVGINIADPTVCSTESGATFRPTGSLWGQGPVMADINRGNVGDCYFLATLAAFANSSPARLQNSAVDLGDGTYVVQYMRGGTPSYVRVDADLPTGWWNGYAYAHPGATGSIWAEIMEKSYAVFRTGVKTFTSISGGWMGDVCDDFGIANTSVGLGSETSFYNQVSAALAAGKPVTVCTYGTVPDLVGNHAYTLVSATISAGKTSYVVRNPWGFSGDNLENSTGYATLTFQQMQNNFTLGDMAV